MAPRSQPAPIPADTVRVARAALPSGTFALHRRDLFPTLYSDAALHGLYPAQGQPAVPPWRLILVTILQFAEDLTDRQAADAMRASTGSVPSACPSPTLALTSPS